MARTNQDQKHHAQFFWWGGAVRKNKPTCTLYTPYTHRICTLCIVLELPVYTCEKWMNPPTPRCPQTKVGLLIDADGFFLLFFYFLFFWCFSSPFFKTKLFFGSNWAGPTCPCHSWILSSYFFLLFSFLFPFISSFFSIPPPPPVAHRHRWDF